MNPQSTSSEVEESGLLRPALGIGALAAGSGFLLGGAVGIIRSKTPFIFALSTSIQAGLAGSTFWATRSALLSYKSRATLDPQTGTAPEFKREQVSATAGGIAGAVNGAISFRPKALIYSVVLFSLIGYSGQRIYDRLDAQDTAPSTPQKENILQQLANGKYSPVKVLNDSEYESLLQEKLLRVETEIALLDDGIGALRKQQQEERERESQKEDRQREQQRVDEGK